MTNAQRTPLVDGLNRFVNDKIFDASELVGKSLPATVVEVDPSGTIVKVNFEIDTKVNIPQVQCPIGFPEWVRWPIQKGDKGFVTSCDLYMGGMSGLGGGKASFTQQPNLTTLIWFPCGNIALPSTDDPQKVVLYGPTGVILEDQQKKCILTLTPDGITITLNGQPYISVNANGMSFTFGGNSITIDSNGINLSSQGAQGININGGSAGTSIDSKLFLPHTHTDVTTGSSDTGAVT